MKTVYMIRHAKSSWEYDVDDHERPLKKRGIRDAERIGKALKEQVNTIDRIVSSDAVRAKTTAEIILKNMNIEQSNLLLEPQLYDFSGQQVLQVIKKTPDEVNTLLIFGHNHAFTYLANALGDKYIDNLPTAGAVALEFDIEKWEDIKVGKNVLTIFPKSLR